MLKGICDICGKPGELHTCAKCGKRVCSRHYTSQGLCTDCAGEKAKPSHEASELLVPKSAKPTTVTPKDVKK